MGSFKYRIPQIICSVVAVVVVLSGFLKVPALKAAGTNLTNWVTVVTPFAMIVGAVSVLKTKVTSVAKHRDREGWLLDAWQAVLTVGVISLGMIGGTTHPLYVWVFDKIVMVLESAVLGLIALLLLSSAWRVLKAKNWESCLFIAGLFVSLLSQVPLGEMVWGGFPKISAFVQNVVSMATMRALGISIALGLITTGLRTILGHEKGYLPQE